MSEDIARAIEAPEEFDVTYETTATERSRPSKWTNGEIAPNTPKIASRLPKPNSGIRRDAAETPDGGSVGVGYRSNRCSS